MKGYYLFAPVEPGNAGPESGVERKVRAQHKALNAYVNCELLILDPVRYTGSKSEKIIRRLPFTAAWRKWKYEGEFDDGDFLYIRQVYHDHSFVSYLKEIRKRNPKIKIIYEIPTYPFDTESKISVSTFSFAMKERLNRKKLAKYIDRIVTFYGQKEIFGIPCIDLINGYDFSTIELPERERTDTVNVISVALTAFWHGYDRFIKGLAEYYENGGNENIVYHYVGTVMPEHREYVKEHHLDEHVIFYGKMSGEPLKELMKRCFIGLDVLGGHRKDYPVSSSLKSREYFAYGIPMITSSPIDFLPKDSPYQFLVPYDDSPVDMKKMLEYYHGYYDGKDCNELAKKMREYGKEVCDMSITMKPVADWLDNNK
ncbi:MAG: glycosyltransferase [Erysipelotrichaceae bacterium]|nr:glycosyltransferase [Erysipelotrichaceae bacterium]